MLQKSHLNLSELSNGNVPNAHHQKIPCNWLNLLSHENIYTKKCKTASNLTHLFASNATVRRCIMGADFTKVAAVKGVVSEATINQPCLIKVWMSCIDVCQLYCNEVLNLLHVHKERNIFHQTITQILCYISKILPVTVLNRECSHSFVSVINFPRLPQV